MFNPIKASVYIEVHVHVLYANIPSNHLIWYIDWIDPGLSSLRSGTLDKI